MVVRVITVVASPGEGQQIVRPTPARHEHPENAAPVGVPPSEFQNARPVQWGSGAARPCPTLLKERCYLRRERRVVDQPHFETAASRQAHIATGARRKTGEKRLRIATREVDPEGALVS